MWLAEEEALVGTRGAFEQQVAGAVLDHLMGDEAQNLNRGLQ